MSATVVVFDSILRLDDHPALAAAVARGAPVIPVFLERDAGGHGPGAASRWWQHRSLEALDAALARAGSRLILRCGPPETALAALVAETGADAVHVTRSYEPGAADREHRLRAAARAAGAEPARYSGRLLFEPEAIRTGGGGAYRVFGAFWRACMAAPEPAPPLPAPTNLPAPPCWPRSDPLDAIALRPAGHDWTGKLEAHWTPGEAGARAARDGFLDTGLQSYAADRDSPGRAGTSRLSPHLHFGELSVRRLWHEARNAAAAEPRRQAGAEKFLAELGWREFSAHLLFAVPDLPEAPLRPEFERFAWTGDPAPGLAAWRRGRTGYPIVDAGMRELWETGWMHNRVRMVAASFLVKHLRIDWRLGAAWFWDTLVDADLASNSASWQWVAGSGADAAPYFRIFNPVLQGERFDTDGTYVRRWVPELSALPDRWLHKPWAAPAHVADAAGIRLGRTYPKPVVDHRGARAAALAAYGRMKSEATSPFDPGGPA